MAKKTDLSNLTNIGLGIWDTLQSGDSDVSKENETVKQQNNISTKEPKSKRSFMLTEAAIQKLNLLKLCSTDNKDLSSIVEDAINMHFEANKGSIEELIKIYDKIKK